MVNSHQRCVQGKKQERMCVGVWEKNRVLFVVHLSNNSNLIIYVKYKHSRSRALGMVTGEEELFTAHALPAR